MGSRSFQFRFYVVNLLFIFLFAPIFLRLVDLQVRRHGELVHKASEQHHITIELEPKRGQIYDRHFKALAASLKVPSIYIVPRLVPKADKKILSKLLARALNLKESFVAERLSRKKAFVWLKRKVSQQEAQAITKMGNPNVGIVYETKRFYPGGSLLAHIIGFCNIDNQGLEGLELYLNKYMVGRPGYRQTKRDALGREIPAFMIREVPPVDGNDVVLTTDRFIQHVTERELNKAFKKWHAEGGVAIVMKPDTGEILAMASRPTYDLNSLQEAPSSARRNRAITDFFEPGSVFKIVTASAALNEHAVKLEDTFYCEKGLYRYPIGNRLVHDVHPYGTLTFPEVIEKSSNIGTVKVALKLGSEKLYQYVKAFGFGEVSGIDFPGEVQGMVHPLKKWSKISITSIPYGQEVAATALQMVTAISVVANGGKLMKPYLVDRIQDEHGVVLQKYGPVMRRPVLTEDTAGTMRQILVHAVEKGTGKAAAIPGVPVAGKTGTAQKILPGGGYSHSNFVSSFIGFAPADAPLFSMIVVLDDPHPSYYGGTVAAPVFQAVAKEILPYLGYVATTPEPQEAKDAKETKAKQT